MEQRSVIKFCVKLKKLATGTFEMLKSAYDEECLSRTSVFEWHKSFKEGWESLQDDERKGRPSTSRTEESTEVIQKCLAEDRTLSVQMLEEMTGINRETVCTILVEDLKNKKMCSFCSSFVNTGSKTSTHCIICWICWNDWWR
jgi:methylthioribose-1-phosphate isomerase